MGSCLWRQLLCWGSWQQVLGCALRLGVLKRVQQQQQWRVREWAQASCISAGVA